MGVYRSEPNKPDMPLLSPTAARPITIARTDHENQPSYSDTHQVGTSLHNHSVVYSNRVPQLDWTRERAGVLGSREFTVRRKGGNESYDNRMQVYEVCLLSVLPSLSGTQPIANGIF